MVDAIIGADHGSNAMVLIEDTCIESLGKLQETAVTALARHHGSGKLHLNKARVAAIVHDVIGDNARKCIVGGQLLDDRGWVATRKQHHSQKGCDVADDKPGWFITSRL